MFRSELGFERPEALDATAPPESRGLARDGVRLMVTREGVQQHVAFRALPSFLSRGDVLIVNDSATIAASLPASGSVGPFTLNLCTRYRNGVWLAEPRWSPSRPGPLPLESDAAIQVAGLNARLLGPYPGQPRLLFVSIEGDVAAAMRRYGHPIRYKYVPQVYPLDIYQTIFARVPGSAEMPSAARPFSATVIEGLRQRGVTVAPITLHTGVSSLELEEERLEDHAMYPEPFEVPRRTAEVVNRAKADGHRVVAVGTTVVRALESAWDGELARPTTGFTRRLVEPKRGLHVVDSLLTGFHDPYTTHLAILYSLMSAGNVRKAYQEGIREGYLWHEFGDSHLILA